MNILVDLINPSRIKPSGFYTKGVSIIADELVKIYRIGKNISVPALRGISFKIRSGEAVSIMGPSGSGKTTLLNIIGGIDKPTSGSIIVENIKVSELDETMLEKYRLCCVGYVFQAFNLIPVLSSIENVELPMIALNVPRDIRIKRANWLLEQVGLIDRIHHKPYELSGGQQQRVAIAIALANDPPLILADEPTAELDTENALNIINLLTKLSTDYGKTVIVSTHDPRMAIRTQRIIRLEDGRAIGEYKPSELISSEIRYSDITSLIKTRLASMEKEIEELVDRFRKGFINHEEFHQKYVKLKNYIEVLKEMLYSSGY